MKADLEPLIDGLLDHLAWLKEEGHTRIPGTPRSGAAFVARAEASAATKETPESGVLLMRARRMAVCGDGETAIAFVAEPGAAAPAGREVLGKILYAMGFEWVGEPEPYAETSLRDPEPAMVISLGAKSLEALTGRKQSIGSARGVWRKCGYVDLMPTFDPVLLGEDKQAKGAVWQDMLAVLKKLGHELPEWSRKFAR